MKYLLLFFISLFAAQTLVSAANSVHEFEVPDIEGNLVNLADYKGQVLLIVNTASKCGFTRQYADLVQLQTEFKDRPFRILGFPANNFGNQEPGSDEQIAQFCEERFDVNFPMFSKLSVRGDDISDLYRYLTTAENPDFTGTIRWNFEKILVGPDGTVLRRFRSMASPTGASVRNAVAEALDSL